MAMNDTRMTLEKPATQSSQRPDDITATRLVKALSLAEDPQLDLHSRLLLFTNDQQRVVGAYFPGPRWMDAEKLKFTISDPPYLLFQLQPEFRLLQYARAGYNRPRNGRTRTGGKEAVVTDDAPSMPYWIGDPGLEGRGAGLRIEPETRSITLMGNSSDGDAGKESWYREVGVGSGGGGAVPRWVVTVEPAQLHIFSVSGGLNGNAGTSRIPLAQRDLSAYTEDSTIPKIGGEELAKRIEGFGSG